MLGVKIMRFTPSHRGCDVLQLMLILENQRRIATELWPFLVEWNSNEMRTSNSEIERILISNWQRRTITSPGLSSLYVILLKFQSYPSKFSNLFSIENKINRNILDVLSQLAHSIQNSTPFNIKHESILRIELSTNKSSHFSTKSIPKRWCNFKTVSSKISSSRKVSTKMSFANLREKKEHNRNVNALPTHCT